MDLLFNKNGYVFLKSVYKKEDLDKITKETFEFINDNNINEELQKKEDVTKNNYYVNNTYSNLNNFFKQQYYYLPVFDNRKGHNRITDSGLIDIYNFHKLIDITKLINIEIILEILKKLTNKNWKLLRVNFHINNNVQNPDVFHYDNNESIKYSIYMNDIIKENGGCLSFIEGTHELKKFSNNQIKNFYGNAGDVLISYQKGFHRKLPQKNSINYFLILNFIPK